MPSQWEFDHLGESGVRRCIWCQTVAKTENDEKRHYRKHVKEREAAKLEALREKEIAEGALQ